MWIFQGSEKNMSIKLMILLGTFYFPVLSLANVFQENSENYHQNTDLTSNKLDDFSILKKIRLLQSLPTSKAMAVNSELVNSLIERSFYNAKSGSLSMSLFLMQQADEFTDSRYLKEKVYLAKKHVKQIIHEKLHTESSSSQFNPSLGKKNAWVEFIQQSEPVQTQIEIRKRIPKKTLDDEENSLRVDDSGFINGIKPAHEYITTKPLDSFFADRTSISNRDDIALGLVEKICSEALKKQASMVIHTKKTSDYRWLLVELKLCTWRKDRLFKFRMVHKPTEEDHVKFEYHPYREKPVFVKAY